MTQTNTQLPLGNDGIFSVFLYYQASEVIGTTGVILNSQPRTPVDLNRVQNLAVNVRHGFTNELTDVPYKVSQDTSNLLIVEFPQEKQRKGAFNVVIEFDVHTGETSDELLHRRIELPLCTVVDTTEVGKTVTASVVGDVLPLMRGPKGDTPAIPRLLLKKDLSNGKSYLWFGTGWLRDEEGNRVMLQREVASTIEYSPRYEHKPSPYPSWERLQVTGYSPADMEQFHGHARPWSDATTIRNFGNMQNILPLPYEPFHRQGCVTYGLYMHFQDNVIMEKIRAHRKINFVMRLEAPEGASVEMRGANSSTNVSVNVAPAVITDVALPIELSGNGEWTVTVTTPDFTTSDAPNFKLWDMSFVDVTAQSLRDLLGDIGVDTEVIR